IVEEKPPVPEKPAAPKVIPAATTPDETDSNIIPNPTEKPDVDQPLTINRDLGKITMPDVTEAGDGSIKSTGSTAGTSEGGEGTDGTNNVTAPAKILSPRDVSKMAAFPGCEKADTTKKALQDCMASKLQEELGIQLNDFGETVVKINLEKVNARLHLI